MSDQEQLSLFQPPARWAVLKNGTVVLETASYRRAALVAERRRRAGQQAIRVEGVEADAEPLDRWSMCVLMAGRLALSEGKLSDSEHVKQLAYRLYEGGAFKEEQPTTKE